MMMKRDNCLLIIAGPSAVGKTTVAYKMIENDPRFEFVRSVTTRQKRGDAYDAEYIYISIPQFKELIANGGVLEHTEYAGNYYGTPRSEVERILSEGKLPLLVLDINGVCSLCANALGLSPCGIYVYDGIDVMERRLYKRFIGDIPTEQGQAKYESRVAQNRRDYSTLVDVQENFFTLIDNRGTPEQTAEKIQEIFASFMDGAEKDSEANAQIASALADSVK